MKIWLIAIILAFGTLLQAQEFRGAIQGRVTDPTSAAVPGAKVQVRNVDTGVVVDVTTNGEGNYQVTFLMPGNYEVSAVQSGFKKSERGGIRVATGAQVAVDFPLQLGSASDTITVDAKAPMLETTEADLGLVMDSGVIADVAMSIYRNAANFVRMAPGVTGAPAGTYTSDNQTQFSISGGGGTQGNNEIILDGVPNTIPLSSGSVVMVPSVDSIEEVKVSTTMFDASYGRSNGGAVTIVTKGGTNRPHADVYFYKRWAALNANSWSNNRVGAAKPPVDFHQYGYFLSGPVYIPHVYDGRNRTFFTTSLEKDADVRDLAQRSRVPTGLERTGDFSQTRNRTNGTLAIYDPFSTQVVAGKATRQAFPGNVIPAGRINATGLAALAGMPLPNLNVTPQIGTFNWYDDKTYTVGQQQESVRIDHTLSNRQRLFGRFSHLTRNQTPEVLIPGVHQYNGSGANIDTYLQWRNSFTLDDTITFSPSMVGSLRYGFARRLNGETWGGVGLDSAPFQLAAQIVNNQTLKGIPEFNLGESVPTLGSRINRLANDLHSVFTTFTKIQGNHNLKFGSDYRLVRYNSANQGTAAAGSFTFNPTFTQADPFATSSANTSGTSMASLLLGVPSSGSLGYTSPLSLQSHYIAGFVQDSWKIGRRLTINAGLRYEIETPYTERYNRVSYGFDRGAALPVQAPGQNLRGGVLFPGVDGRSRTEGNVDKNNFGPRFGFAWQPLNGTVIRGGYGLFFSSALSNVGSLGNIGVFDAVTPYVGSVDSGATPFTTIANPFPNGLRSPLGNSPGLMAQVGDGLTFINQDRVAPYNQQRQFSIQQQLPGKVVLEAAYAAMLSVKQLETYNLNELPDAYLPQGSAQNTAVRNPFLGVFPATSALGQGTTVSQRQLWLQFPQFTSVNMNGANTGTTTYNAIQLKAEKRLSRGLSLIGTYSFSKLIHNNMTSLVNARNYRSIASLDQPQLLRLTFTYLIPFSYGHNPGGRVLRSVLGGWAVTGFLSLESGLPLSITQSNGRPMVISDPRVDGPVNQRLGDRKDSAGNVLNPYFDAKAFQSLANQYLISPQSPYISQLRGPGQRSLNASAFKYFPIHERMKLELRLEAINATNHPYFNSPGTNMSTSGSFGVISGASNSRAMQAGLKLKF